MSGPARRCRLRLPASPPELSSAAGRLRPSRRRASPDSHDPSAAHGSIAASARSVVCAGRRGLVAALLALPLLTGLATVAQAQTTWSVGNISGTFDGTRSLESDQAQAFTTGGSVDGYIFQSVEIRFAQVSDTGASSKLTVTVRRDSGGKPGAVVGTLTNPAFPASTTDRLYEFAAPDLSLPNSGIELAPNTTYWIVIDVTAALTGDNELRSTAQNHEDYTEISPVSASRIANTSRHRSRGSSGSWSTNSEALKINVNGVLVHPEVAFASERITVTEGERIVLKLVLDRVRTVDTRIAVHDFERTAVDGVGDTDTDGNAVPADYVPGPYEVVIPAGKTEAPVNVPTVQDRLREAGEDENFLLRAFSTNAPGVLVVWPESAVVSIEDDEYTLAFRNQTYISSEEEGEAELPLILDRHLDRDIRFRLEYLGLNATPRGDFLLVRDVTIPAGSVAHVVRIPIVNDSLVEDSELFRVTIRDPNQPENLPASTADVIINGTDFATEDENGAEVIVNYDRQGSGDSFGCFAAGEGIALPDGSGGTVTYPSRGRQVFPPPDGLVVAWDRASYTVGDTARIRVRTSDGLRSCTDIRFTVEVDQTPRRWRGTPSMLSPMGRQHLWLRRGETQGEASFEVVAPGTMHFQVERVHAAVKEISNPEHPRAEQVPIAPPVPVDGHGNTLTVSSDLKTATKVSATASCARTGSNGCLYFQSKSFDVLENTARTYDLKVAVEPPPASDYSLGFTLSGTATPGADYTIPGRSGGSGTVTVPANAGSVTIPVTIVDDDIDDDGETITVHLQDGGSYDATAPDSVTLTIRNDDPLSADTPEVTIAAGDGVTEGGSASFTLTASPAPAEPLDVSVTVAASGDYGIAAGTQAVTIPTTGSATLTLATTGDDADEADGSVSVTVDAGTGYTVGDASSGSVAIADDDAPAQETGATLPGTVAGPVSNGVVTLARPAAWTGSGKIQFGGGSKARDKGRFTALRIGTVDSDSFEVAWASREPGTLRLTLEWQPIAGSSWRPSDGDARDPRVLTIEDPAPTQPATTTDPAPVPEIAIAAGSGVTEGGSASFTLTATPAPAAPLEVTVTIAATGAFGVAAGERTVTIPTTGSATLTLATLGDGTDEPDGSVTVTVDAGTGYTVGSASSGTVAIADDDLPPPEISVSGGTGVTEGQNAVFTVTANRAPDADLAVTLNVTEKADSDFVAAADEGEKTVTVLAGETSATLTVATADDEAYEPDGSVTATVDAGDGYTVAASPNAAASVAIADNDAAGPLLVSVGDATAREGQTMQFPVRLSAPAEHDVLVRLIAEESDPVSARAGLDFRGPYYTKMIWIEAGKTVGYFPVLIKDDSHDDGGETFEARVLFVYQGTAGVADGVGTGTIENADPLPAAYLARFGRTVAEQALEGIAGRMAADRTPGMQGTVAGQALTFDPSASDRATATGATPGATPADREAVLTMADIARGLGAGASAPAGPGGAADRFGGGHGLGESRTMTARDALLGSSFSLTGQRDGSGGSLAFWGRASQGSFDGAERGDGTDITLDGTVTTGMLGADYARGKWLVGLALTQSTSDGKYAAIGDNPCPEVDGEVPDLCDGAVRAGDGKVEASLTAAVPYAAWQASERLKLWGAAGYGTGEVTLKTMEESYRADTSWTMAAAGVRGDLLEAPQEGSGPALALTSDALWARTSSDKTGELNATDSDVTRLRLGMEGSYRMALADGGSLIPKLEIGARHDGGDAETGFGVEVGGGIAWVDPSLGLSLDLSGRTLLAHENDDLKDRGFSAALGFDPAPATRRGPSFSLRQDFGGQAQGGLDALFANDPLEDRSGSEAASRWAMEAAYGFPVFGDRFTGSPQVGFGLSTAARDYSLGWRLTPEAATAPDLSFGLKATRRESDAAEAEHAIGFELTARW